MRDKLHRIGHCLALVFIVCMGLTGCGSQAGYSDAITKSENAPSHPIGTDGQLIYIQSDNVQAAGYDEASRVMTVQFDNGAIYEYYGVSTDLWESFVAAQPHPWSQVGYPRLVQAGIPYRRIG